MRLALADGLDIRCDHLFKGTEVALAGVEAPCAQCIDGPVIRKAAGETDEYEHLTGAWMYAEEGCFVAGHLQGNQWVVWSHARMARPSQVGGQLAHRGILQNHGYREICQ